MNVDHSKYLHSVKIKEVVTTATIATATAANTVAGVTGCKKVGRRRRMISREASNLSNSSVEAGGGEYHAQEPAAVPFMWESSPGTPKRHIIMRSSNYDHDIDHLFPPLTPPPSYQYKGNKYATTRIRPTSSCSKKKKENDANNNNSNLIQSIFPRLSFKRENSPTLSSSSSTKSSSRPSTSTSPSSSSSSPSSQPRSVVLTPSPIRSRQRLPSYDQYFSATEVEEEEEGVVGRSGGSPVSTLCFRRFSCCNAKFRGLYSSWF